MSDSLEEQDQYVVLRPKSPFNLFLGQNGGWTEAWHSPALFNTREEAEKACPPGCIVVLKK